VQALPVRQAVDQRMAETKSKGEGTVFLVEEAINAEAMRHPICGYAAKRGR